MDDISSLYSLCSNCSICQNISGDVVAGGGNKNADLMFVSLHPLIGKAKHKLNKILAYMEIDREDIWTTTTVKHISPNFSLDSVHNCKSFLMQEIELISPKIIWISGQEALYSFFPDKKISMLRGAIFESFEYPELLFCCTYDITKMTLDDGELATLKSKNKMDYENYIKKHLELTYDINKLISILKGV